MHVRAYSEEPFVAARNVVDWIRVRPVVANEPATAWGVEERAQFDRVECGMNLAEYYDEYWRVHGDNFNTDRLRLIAERVNAGEDVLEVDCGPGVLAAHDG